MFLFLGLMDKVYMEIINMEDIDKNAKRLVYDHFMEQHWEEIREYKIKKILKK